MSLKTLSVIALAAGALGLCSSAYASNGFYVGGQAGYGNAGYDTTGTSSTDEGGFAGRAYAGFQFNRYFGLESGYTWFSDNTYKFLGDTLKVTTKTDQWDILAKAGMPFGCTGFRGDIKAGAAYVMTDADTDFLGSEVASDSDNKWEPAAGASISYNFNKNFAADISYLHAFGSSDDNNFNKPDTDLATLGVSYLFALS